MPVIHLITPEYPPAIGGVADYTRQVAHGLADAGDDVHVWCPWTAQADEQQTRTVAVHRTLGTFTPDDLRETDARLNTFPEPRRIVVQWVPHGYGRRAMNVPFCLWLKRRADKGDRIELMVHEPSLEFGGTLRQTAAAAVHRVMTVVLLRAATRVWMSIPGWQPRLKPYAFGRALPFAWLPIPSALNQPSRDRVAKARVDLGGEHACLVGHVSTYGSLVSTLLDALAPDLLQSARGARLVLIGRNSTAYATALRDRHPDVRDRIVATGHLDAAEMSTHIAACDVLIQPYPDGVSTRRTTAMAGLFLGVPVITTSGHLTEPLWEESRAVRLAAVGDWHAFNASVCRLLSNADERRRLALDARRYYDEHFDVRHTIFALRSAA
jgi:glycosyltransferase involved in cell wall biosynthesis